MRILMTGVTSFIGSALAKELIRRGHEVYGVVRPDSPNRDLAERITGMQLVEADMSDFGQLADRGLPEMDVCIHLSWAGPGRVNRQDPAIQEANGKAALDMLSAAGKLGCRSFLFSGSQAEYGVTAERVRDGNCSGKPVSEETPCAPLSEYGKWKLKMYSECGNLAKELGIRYTHLRIFSVYGEGDHPSTLVNLCCRAFSQGEHLKLSACAQDWNMLYISDCAAAIANLAESRTAEGIVNIGSEDTRTLREFVEEIRSICGKGSYELEGVIPSPEGTPWVSPDISKLKKLTGFQPEVSFREGVSRILRSI